MNPIEEHPLRETLPSSNFGAGSLVRTVIELPTAAPNWAGLAVTAAQQLLGADRPLVAVGHEVPGHDCLRPRTRSDVEALSDFFKGDRRGANLLALEFFEQQADPRALVRILKALLLSESIQRLLIAFPHRSATNLAEPAPTHFREWSPDEFERFLRACGFTVGTATPLSDDASLIEVSLSRAAHESFLAQHALPSGLLRELILTTEHGACRVTGGIGSYVEERLNGGDPALGMLLLTGADNLPRQLPEGQRWLTREALGISAPDPDLAQDALETLQQVLLYYPELQGLEVQEYLGVGARIVQARMAGLLPPGLRIDVCCHGSQVYLENSFEQWQGQERLRTHAEERISLEYADRVIFPTRFLANLYETSGYRISPERRVIRRYPFRGFTPQDQPSSLRAADTLLFFGKRTRMKGFPLFVAALQRLLDQRGAPNLRRLVLVGPKDPQLEAENRIIDGLRGRLEVVEHSLPRHQALALLRDEAPRALCVTPYTADNHPVSVLEVVAAGAQLVATARGGIPELIPSDFHPQVLAEATPAALCTRLAEALTLTGEERSSRVRALGNAMREVQARINEEVEQLPSAASPGAATAGHPSPGRMGDGAISVIVPSFETDERHLRELIWGLNHQTLPPAKVVFVDDGSTPSFVTMLQRLAESELRAPFEIVRHEANEGLPAARNSGLKRLTTEYVANLDSDDIPKNDFLETFVRMLDADPTFVAATSYSDFFPDGDRWHLRIDTEPDAYRPHGTGLVWAQFENCLGHANSAFRVAELREAGGWDSSENAKWEDYALFLRLLSSGDRIGVVPRGTFLYRYRPTSMARTYPKYPAERRVARAVKGIDTFESFRLRAVLTRGTQVERELNAELETLRQELAAARREIDERDRELGRVRYRAIRGAAAAIEGRPELFHALRQAHHQFALLSERYRVNGRGMRHLAEQAVGAARRLIGGGKGHDHNE